MGPLQYYWNEREEEEKRRRKEKKVQSRLKGKVNDAKETRHEIENDPLLTGTKS